MATFSETITNRHKYYGSFKDRNGQTYTVNIYPLALAADTEIVFGADPVHLSFSQPNPHAGAVGTTLTMQIITDELMDCLYSEDPLGTPVELRNGPYSQVWTGYVSRAEYDQEYLPGTMHEIIIEAVDAISLAPSLPYKHTSSARRSLMSLVTLVEKFADEVGQQVSIIDTARLSTTFSEDAFLPYDHKLGQEDDDWMNWGEILTGVFSSFGLTLSSMAGIFVISKWDDPGTTYNCYAYDTTNGNNVWTLADDEQLFATMVRPSMEFASNLLRGGRLTIRPSYGVADFAVARQESRPLWYDILDAERMEGRGSWNNQILSNVEVYNDGEKKVIMHTRAASTEQDALAGSGYHDDWLGPFCTCDIYEYDSYSDEWKLRETVKGLGPGTYQLRTIAQHPFVNLPDYVDIDVTAYPTVETLSINISVDGTASTSQYVFRRVNEARGINQWYYTIHLGKSAGVVSPIITVPEGCCVTQLCISKPDPDVGFTGNHKFDGVPLDRTNVNSRSLDKFSYTPILGYCQGSLVPGNVSSADGVGPLTGWLEYPHREYKVSRLFDSPQLLWPWQYGTFQGNECHLVGLDYDYRQAIADMSIQLNYWPYRPTEEIWYIRAVTAYTLAVGNIGSDGYIAVDPSGQEFMIRANVTVQLISTLGNTTSDTGSVNVIRQRYGINLYLIIDEGIEHLSGGGDVLDNAPDIVVQETTNASYEGFIRIGEWTGIDSHIIQFQIALGYSYRETIYSVSQTATRTTSSIRFKQYPVEEY